MATDADERLNPDHAHAERKVMRLRRAVFAAVVSLCLTAPNSWAADNVAEQKAKVTDTERHLRELSAKLSKLLAEMDATHVAVTSASGSLAVARLQMETAQKRADAARDSLNVRARSAYKRRPLGNLESLMGIRDFARVLGFSRILFETNDIDRQVLDRAIASQNQIQQAREDTVTQRQALFAATKRIDELRSDLQKTISLEQNALSEARARLSSLEAERKKRELAVRRTDSGRIVSPVVAARRAARQVDLDRKLAALLAWYAPGTGNEPFTPPRLRPTGIVTTGSSSWYGPGFDGRRASSGATYNQGQLTAASLVLPFGTLLKVTLGSKSAVVVITDRGPYIAGRVLDLSAGAAQAIGLSGVKQVRMEIMVPKEPAPPFP